MKLIHKSLLFSAVICLILTSCIQFQDLTVPKKVQVKTSAEYNFTIIDFEKDFQDILSVNALKESMGLDADNAPYELYDYNPGGNQKVQSFLVRMPIQEIPIDMASYMSSIDIGKNLDSMSFEQDIAIPEINLNFSQKIDLADINKMVIPMVTIGGRTGDGNQTVSFDNFESVEVLNGVLQVQTAATGKVDLYTGPGLTKEDCSASNKIASGTISGGKVSFDLAGKTLYGKGHTFINFVDDNSNNDFIGAFTDDSTKFKKVTGLTVKNEHDVLEEQDIPMDSITFDAPGEGSPVVSCSFKTGSSMTLSVKTPGWTNVTIVKDFKLEGGLEGNFTGNEEDISLDLGGKTYKNQDITITPELKIKFEDTTIDFTQKPEISLKTNVTGFDSVISKLPEGLKTEFDTSIPLPEMATKILKNVTWKAGSGIKIEYTNTLPAGNNITMKASSAFIELSEVSNTIESTGAMEKKSADFLTNTDTDSPISNTSVVDFKAAITLPNYDNVKKTIEIVNVVPGDTYKISMKIQPVFDWESITLDLSSLGDSTNVNGKISMDINPASLLSALDDALQLPDDEKIAGKIKPKALDIKLFCEKPSLSIFDSISFKGKIILGRTTDGGATFIPDSEQYILGTVSEKKEMPMNGEPLLNKDSNGTIITDVSSSPCLGFNLAETINVLGNGESVGLNYNLALAGTNGSSDIVINQDDLKNATSTSMKIVAYFILPLSLNCEDDIAIDILKIAGMEYKPGDPDLLGRTDNPKLEDETLDKALAIIDSVGLNYVPSKIPLLGSAKIKIDLDGSDTHFDEQTIPLSGGVYSEKPSDILNNYVRPKVLICLDRGEISLPREMAFKTRLDLKIKTNGEPLEFALGGE